MSTDLPSLSAINSQTGANHNFFDCSLLNKIELKGLGDKVGFYGDSRKLFRPLHFNRFIVFSYLNEIAAITVLPVYRTPLLCRLSLSFHGL